MQRLLALVLVSALVFGPTTAVAQDETTAVGHRGEVDSQSAVGGVSVAPNLFTGAANFSIPIVVPPGAGGLTPQVSLNYSSQSLADSWVGYGWSLSFSSIRRSLKRGVPTYDNSQDLFTLDGGELVEMSVATNGNTVTTTYETERESFRRIVHEVDATAGTDLWHVTDKNGTKAIYEVTTGRSAAEIFEWHLTELEDPAGNYIAYAYTLVQANGYPAVAYPLAVTYTLRRSGPNPTSRNIVFATEASERPDQPTSYAAGFPQKLEKRLDYVDVRVGSLLGSDLIRRYDLAYSESPDTFRSLLDSVSLYGVDAGDPSPTAPLVTSFDYHSNVTSDTVGWTPEETAWEAAWPEAAGQPLKFVENGRDKGLRLGDINGDGRADLVKALADRGTGNNECGDLSYAASEGNGIYLAEYSDPGGGQSPVGWSSTPSTVYEFPPMWQQDCNGDRDMVQHFVEKRNGKDWGSGLTLVDINGDHRADFIGAAGRLGTSQQQRHSNQWCVSTETGLDCAADPGVGAPYSGLSSRAHMSRTGGYADSISQTNFQFPCSETSYDISESDRTWSGNTRFGDLNGDGLPEIIVRGREKYSGGSIVNFLDPSCPTPAKLILRIHSFQHLNLSTPGGATNINFQSDVDLSGSTTTGQTFGYDLLEHRMSSAFLPCDPTLPPPDGPDCARKSLFQQASLRSHSSDQYTISDQFYGSEVVDLNGDGLADQISSRKEDSSSPIRAAWINTGDEQLDPKPEWEMAAGHLSHIVDVTSFAIHGDISRDNGWRFADVNGDGRVDLLFARQGSTNAIYLNDGDTDDGTGDTSPWQPGWGDAASDVPNFTDQSDGKDLGVRLADVDGDGMVDIVEAIGGSEVKVHLNKASTPDLLTKVTNPQSGTATLEYKAATELGLPAGATPGLALPLPILTASTTDPTFGASQAARTEYEYSGGLFDAVDREFRGFATVAVTDPLGLETHYEFHQTADRAGLLERRSQFSPPVAGFALCWEKVEPEYTVDADGLPPYRSFLRQTLRSEQNGFCLINPPRQSLVAYEYDFDAPPPEGVFGNRTATIEYGAVTGNAQSGYTTIPDDVPYARTTVLEYDVDTAGGNYLVGRVSRRLLRQGTNSTSGPIERETTWDFADTDVPTHPTAANVILGAGRVETTSYSYDDFGNILTFTDPGENQSPGTGGTTTYEYDAGYQTFRTKVIEPNGDETVTGYTASCANSFPVGAGLPHTVVGPNAGVAKTCYDAMGRPVSYTAPSFLAATVWTYSADHRDVVRADVVDGGTRAETTRHDGLGRVVDTTVEGPQGETVVTERSYDLGGRLVSVDGPRFSSAASIETTFQYDGFGRPTMTTLPGNRVSLQIYDEDEDGLVIFRDAEGNDRQEFRDVFGNIRRVDEILGGATLSTHYEYSVAGELEEVTDSAQNVTSIIYDNAGRKTQLIDPSVGTTDYTYDYNGNLDTQISARGVELDWDYDVLNRPTQLTVDGATESTWAYDDSPNGRGLLYTRTDTAGVYEVLSYDEMGRVLQESMTIELPATVTNTFTNTYTAFGQLETREYPNGVRVRWNRDNKGYLTAIRRDDVVANLAVAVTWDALDRLTTWTAGNGVTNERTFSPTTGRLIQSQVEGGTLEHLLYGYKPDDQLSQIVDFRDSSQNRFFAYDELNRLESSRGPFGGQHSSQTLRYEYDTLGNMTCQGKVGTGACPASNHRVFGGLGAGPHIATTIGAETPGYDGGGNLTTLGARTYGYDGLEQLTTVADGGAPLATYTYNGDGQRAKAVETLGAATRTTWIVAPDFDWDETNGLGSVHVSLAGSQVATLVEPHDPQGTPAGAPPGLRPGPRLVLPTAPQIGGGAFGLLALLLAAQLLVLRRRGLGVATPALASSTAWLFLVFTAPPVWASPDGDVNESASLDAADLIRLHLLATQLGASPTAGELAHGDVAPLGGPPDGTLDLGDATLLGRALNGEDVDGDGLSSAAELTHGANPFDPDTDGDGATDDVEIARGTRPDCHDTLDADCDGLSNSSESASGTDPFSADTDGDGIEDADEPGAARSGVRYRHGDHLGSSTLLTGAAGTEIARLVYAPFGGLVGSDAVEAQDLEARFGFTGQRIAPRLALQDYGARWYDPAIGRFLQPDSIVPDPFDPQSLNRYSYSLNDPVNRVDPSGNFSFSVGLGFGTFSYSGGSFGFSLGFSLGGGFSTGAFVGDGFGFGAFLGGPSHFGLFFSGNQLGSVPSFGAGAVSSLAPEPGDFAALSGDDLKALEMQKMTGDLPTVAEFNAAYQQGLTVLADEVDGTRFTSNSGFGVGYLDSNDNYVNFVGLPRDQQLRQLKRPDSRGLKGITDPKTGRSTIFRGAAITGVFKDKAGKTRTFSTRLGAVMFAIRHENQHFLCPRCTEAQIDGRIP